MSNESENKEENDDQYVKDMLEKKRMEDWRCPGCGQGWRAHSYRGCPDE
tara:strand:- start:139 stop:285 length:147 start_codon:yes stop_codon:yes gene_type:complete